MDEKTSSKELPANARRRFTTEQKGAILERYRASGLSQGVFASSEGIALATLTRWLRKERKAGKRVDAAESAVELGRLGLLGSRQEWAEVVRPDGWRVRLLGRCDRERLQILFSSLPPCSR
jgi:transposase-like protein